MQGNTHTFTRLMDTQELFFKDKTLHFFGPLTGRFREMAVACIRNLYLRLNGPEADYSYHLTRVDVLDIFVSSIRSAPALDDDAPMAAVAKMSVADRAAWMLKRLADSGWIEAYMDSGTMQTAYRFTAQGRQFATTFCFAALGDYHQHPAHPQHLVPSSKLCHQVGGRGRISGRPDDRRQALR